jgi:hypothetical protein
LDSAIDQWCAHPIARDGRKPISGREKGNQARGDESSWCVLDARPKKMKMGEQARANDCAEAMKNQSNIHCLGERAEKYGRLLLEKNGEEKTTQAQSENRIDLLILDETNRANRQRKLRTNSSSQLRSEHE